MHRAFFAWLVVVFVFGCSASDVPPRADAGSMDARADVGRECLVNTDCDDRVECTIDRCADGRCIREPTALRCGEGSACDPQRGCLPRRACMSDPDCGDDDPCTANERCQLSGSYCLFDPLPNDSPCGDGRVCRGGACACPLARPMRCVRECVDPRTDPNHCGTCGVSCGAGAWCSEARCACSTPQVWCPRTGCTDLTLDSANCGACGSPCSSPATCSNGRCQQPCPPMNHRCGDACVSDDVATSCGTRCMPCPIPEHGSAVCMGSGPGALCAVTCATGYHACGTRCADNNAPDTCGDRCTPCPPVEHGSVACTAGACVITCATGYHRCGGLCAADSSPATCGSRCDACPTPENGEAICVAGRCDFTCRTSFRRCDNVCSDGTSPLGCGPSCTRCAVPANGVATCAMGACGFRCNSAFHACGSACMDDTSPASCGSRCEPCVVPAHAAGTCAMGVCGFDCDPGYAREGDRCRELPRLRAPPSGSFTTGRRPTFRWSLPMDAPEGAVLEVCRDRMCRTVVATLPAATGSARPMSDLPAVTLFWRVRAGTAVSAVWELSVTGRASLDAPVATWGDNPDFDGDGFADVVASAPLLVMPVARFYVYRGTSGGVTPIGRGIFNDPTPALVSAAPTQFAWTLAAADFTGDGYTDLAVGAPGFNNLTGRVYVYHGSPDGIAPTPVTVLDGRDGERAQFGAAISSAGDLNGDGYVDMAIGARGARDGRVYVYYSTGRGVPREPSVTLDGPMASMSEFGAAIAAAGDLDADGFGDLVVGALEYSFGVGRAFVFRGGAMGLNPTPVVLSDPFGGRLGSSVAGVGDTNGDGYPDIAASAPALDNGTGRVHVFHGGAMGVITPAARTINGPAGMEGDFGTVVTAAGDTNGDGFADLFASAPRVDNYNGRAYVFRGSVTGVATTPAHNLFDAMAGSRALFGGSLGGARDVDNDGFSDVVVSAERATMFTGQITILRGSASGLGSPTVFTGPEGPGNRFGISLAWRDAVCRAPRAT